MLTTLAGVTAFQPGLMRPQRSPSKLAPRAIEMLDPGLVNADMIGRASVFGLCCYTVLQFVDPPSFRRHRRPPPLRRLRCRRLLACLFTYLQQLTSYRYDC